MPFTTTSERVLPARIGPSGRRLRRKGHIWMIAGYLVGAWVLVMMPKLGMENAESTGETIWYVFLGYLCGLPLFAGLPWMIGYSSWRNGRERLVLSGTELRVDGLRRASSFDLTTARMAVELIGGLRENNVTKKLAAGNRALLENRLGQGGAGPFARTSEPGDPAHYVIPYHPVLVLYRDRDGLAIPVELCDVASRQMRDPQETLLLAQIMATSTDPKIQYTAGQLRTIARWRQLPQITDADPHAVPVTPVDHPDTAPVIPTPVRAGTPAPEIQIVPGR